MPSTEHAVILELVQVAHIGGDEMVWSVFALLFLISACPYLFGRSNRYARRQTQRVLKPAPELPSDTALNSLLDIYVRRDRYIIGVGAASLALYEILLRASIGEIPETFAVLSPSITHGAFSFLIAAIMYSSVSAIYTARKTYLETEPAARSAKVARTKTAHTADYVSGFERTVPIILTVAVCVVGVVAFLQTSPPSGSTAAVVYLIGTSLVVVLGLVIWWIAETLSQRTVRGGSKFDIYGIDLLRSSSIRALFWAWTAVAVIVLVTCLLFFGAALSSTSLGGAVIVLSVFGGLAVSAFYALVVSSRILDDHFVRRLWQPAPES